MRNEGKERKKERAWLLELHCYCAKMEKDGEGGRGVVWLTQTDLNSNKVFVRLFQ